MAQATQMSNHPNHSPRRPRKDPYRDGASKSAQQYDLYEMIRNPHAPKNRRPPTSLSNVNSENRLTKQQKVDREVKAKFEENIPQLLWNRFKWVGWLARMIFLVMVLPFYILLFALPKKIFKVFIPYVLQHVYGYISKRINGVLKKMKTLYNKVFTPFKLLWMALKPTSGKKKRDLQKEFEDQGLGFFAFIAMGLLYLLSPIVNSCYKIYSFTNKVIKIVKGLPDKIGNMFSVFNKGIQTIVASLKPKVIRDKLKKMAIRYWKSATSRFQEQVVGRVKRVLQKVRLYFYFLGKRIKIEIDKPVKFLKNWNHSVVAFLAKLRQRVITAFSEMKVDALVKASKKWVQNINKQRTGKLQFNIKPQMNYVISLPKTYLQDLKKALPNFKKPISIIESTFSKIKTYFNVINAKIKAKFNRAKNRVRGWLKRIVPYVDPIKKIGRKTYSLFPKIDWTQKKFFYGLDRVFKPVKKISSEIGAKAVSYKNVVAKDYLNPLYLRISSKGENFLLKVRQAIAWAKVLVVYGMYQVNLVIYEMGLSC